MLTKVNLAESLATFTETWIPKIAGDVNDFHVKLAKLDGAFVWHQHDTQDEFFLVIKGRLTMRLRDGDVEVNEGEFIIVPHGTEHMPVADEETHVLLFEHATTINTGNVVNERTIAHPERL